MSETLAWLARVTDGASARQIAEKVPYSARTISRWIHADAVPCEATVRIARAFHTDVLEELIAGQHIGEEDATLAVKTEHVIRSAPSEMITNEVQRRLKAYEATLNRV